MNVLQNVMQIIDSISDKIPENVYLALCNELKKLYAFIPDKIRPALSRTNSGVISPANGYWFR
tara:strand:- start:80 stop:268 length:189 start_codon:yes stop_codon:yes gene_type:complete